MQTLKEYRDNIKHETFLRRETYFSATNGKKNLALEPRWCFAAMSSFFYGANSVPQNVSYDIVLYPNKKFAMHNVVASPEEMVPLMDALKSCCGVDYEIDSSLADEIHLKVTITGNRVQQLLVLTYIRRFYEPPFNYQYMLFLANQDDTIVRRIGVLNFLAIADAIAWNVAGFSAPNHALQAKSAEIFLFHKNEFEQRFKNIEKNSSVWSFFHRAEDKGFDINAYMKQHEDINALFEADSQKLTESEFNRMFKEIKTIINEVIQNENSADYGWC